MPWIDPFPNFTIFMPHSRYNFHQISHVYTIVTQLGVPVLNLEEDVITMQENEMDIIRIISRQVSKTFELIREDLVKRRRPRTDREKDLNPDLGFVPDYGGKMVSLMSIV